MAIMKKMVLLLLLAINCFVAPSHADSCVEGVKNDKYFRSMVTLGDSITYSDFGDYLRCMLDNKGLGYDFKGTKLDKFGYKHEGYGGYSTQMIIDRMDSIPRADAYFILLGTNDWTFTPIQTVNNLMIIAYNIIDKNPNSIIYISTLLPRFTPYHERNLAVNAILLSNEWGSNIHVLDIGGAFYALKDWESYLMPDILHPNYKGYDAITDSIANSLN